MRYIWLKKCNSDSHSFYTFAGFQSTPENDEKIIKEFQQTSNATKLLLIDLNRCAKVISKTTKDQNNATN